MAETLCQLEFVVESAEWTDGETAADGGQCVAVAVQFLGRPEQTVCEFEMVASSTAGCAAPVNAGKTFTFASNEPCPMVAMDVRLYRLFGADMLPSREELGRGTIDVPFDDASELDAGADVIQQLVPIVAHDTQKPAVVLGVRLRATCAGPVLATPLQLQRPVMVAKSTERSQSRVSCSSKHQCAVARTESAAVCCAESPPKCPKKKTCRHRCARKAHGNCSANNTEDTYRGGGGGELDVRNQQYTSVGCEIDGRKIDLRVRKKNYETCVVERRLKSEAEALASKVMGVVKDMHQMVGELVETTAKSTVNRQNSS